MLILTRRIGINAPKNIAVHREEIYRRIEDEKAILAQEINPTSETDTSEVVTY